MIFRAVANAKQPLQHTGWNSAAYCPPPTSWGTPDLSPGTHGTQRRNFEAQLLIKRTRALPGTEDYKQGTRRNREPHGSPETHHPAVPRGRRGGRALGWGRGRLSGPRGRCRRGGLWRPRTPRGCTVKWGARNPEHSPEGENDQ